MLNRKVLQNIRFIYFLHISIWLLGSTEKFEYKSFPIKAVKDLHSQKYRLLLLALEISVANN